jgi:hypothetical protein
MNSYSTYTSNGRHYGYPPCCIADFIEGLRRRDSATTVAEYRKANRARLRRHKGKPWTDEGFLPCKKCSPIAVQNFAKFVAENINPRRKHPEPFRIPEARGRGKGAG